MIKAMALLHDHHATLVMDETTVEFSERLCDSLELVAWCFVIRKYA